MIVIVQGPRRAKPALRYHRISHRTENNTVCDALYASLPSMSTLTRLGPPRRPERHSGRAATGTRRGRQRPDGDSENADPHTRIGVLRILGSLQANQVVPLSPCPGVPTSVVGVLSQTPPSGNESRGIRRAGVAVRRTRGLVRHRQPKGVRPFQCTRTAERLSPRSARHVRQNDQWPGGTGGDHSERRAMLPFDRAMRTYSRSAVIYRPFTRSARTWYDTS